MSVRRSTLLPKYCTRSAALKGLINASGIPSSNGGVRQKKAKSGIAKPKKTQRAKQLVEQVKKATVQTEKCQKKQKKKKKPNLATTKTSAGSRLQKAAQKEFTATPQYQLMAEKGPDDSKYFKICAVIGGFHYPAAWGRRRKEAEEKAAMNALAVISSEPIPYEEEESPISRLQEVAQIVFAATPHYQLLAEKGPDHSKCFKISAVIGKYHYPAAWGRRKKEAEEKAAMNALAVINGEPMLVLKLVQFVSGTLFS